MFQWAGIVFCLQRLQGCEEFIKRDYLWSKQVTKKGLDLASGFEQIPEPMCRWSWQHERKAEPRLHASMFS